MLRYSFQFSSLFNSQSWLEIMQLSIDHAEYQQDLELHTISMSKYDQSANESIQEFHYGWDYVE